MSGILMATFETHSATKHDRYFARKQEMFTIIS